MERMKVILGVVVLVFVFPAFSWAQFDLWNAEDYNIDLEGATGSRNWILR